MIHVSALRDSVLVLVRGGGAAWLRLAWLTPHSPKPAANAIANVAQLAVDALIATHAAERLGALPMPLLAPCAGHAAHADADPALATACDVFATPDRAVTFLQIRAPVLKGKRVEFSRDLVHWISTCGFKFVVMLAGADATRRTDPQIGQTLRYTATSTFKASALKNLADLTRLEVRPDAALADEFTPLERETLPHDLLAVGGDGVAKFVFRLCENSDVQLLCLLRFVVEGDNVADAVDFASQLRDLLGMESKPIKIPQSWRHMYGSFHHRQDLFQ